MTKELVCKTPSFRLQGFAGLRFAFPVIVGDAEPMTTNPGYRTMELKDARIDAAALEAAADGLIAKARREMEKDSLRFPMELFDKARELSATAARLRGK